MYFFVRFPLYADSSSSFYISGIGSPTVTSPQKISLSSSPSTHGSGQKTVFIGSMIAGSLIGASVIIGLSLNKSPHPVAQTASSPNIAPQSGKSPATDSPNPKPTSANQSTVTPDHTSTPVRPSLAVTPQANFTQTEDYSWSYKSVTETDLSAKSAFELDILRNSVFARHSRRFRNQALQNYFNNQSWYRPIYSPEEFPSNLLSGLEQKNAADILQYQNRYGLRWVR